MKDNLENRYKAVIQEVLVDNVNRQDRTGVGCLSGFNHQLSWKLNKFPIMTGKAMYPKVFNTEFKWFINGETNIKRFQDNGVKIWDEWADENGDLGPVYGHQMRNFNDQGVDQMERLIWNLRNNRDSRRHIISLWNPAQIHQMALPPCYLYFQFFVDKGERLNMFVVQRSADLFLGVPYDIALFSMLLLHVAKESNYLTGRIDLQLVDAHIYSNHISAVDEYLRQPTSEFPDYDFVDGQIKLKNYIKGKSIKAAVAV